MRENAYVIGMDYVSLFLSRIEPLTYSGYNVEKNWEVHGDLKDSPGLLYKFTSINETIGLHSTHIEVVFGI